jgi:hypothetical protein
MDFRFRHRYIEYGIDSLNRSLCCDRRRFCGTASDPSHPWSGKPPAWFAAPVRNGSSGLDEQRISGGNFPTGKTPSTSFASSVAYSGNRIRPTAFARVPWWNATTRGAPGGNTVWSDPKRSASGCAGEENRTIPGCGSDVPRALLPGRGPVNSPGPRAQKEV